jgi:hypothetical protein
MSSNCTLFPFAFTFPILSTLGDTKVVPLEFYCMDTICLRMSGDDTGVRDTFAAGSATVYRSTESSTISTVTVYCCGNVVHRSSFSFWIYNTSYNILLHRRIKWCHSFCNHSCVRMSSVTSGGDNASIGSVQDRLAASHYQFRDNILFNFFGESGKRMTPMFPSI